ncbi:Protein kinase domain-containing protein [Psidium guajava]|nr:Protein kinase domain-containing protein [Psidium guajava]
MASKFYSSPLLKPQQAHRDAGGFEAHVHKVKMLFGRSGAAVELTTEVPGDRTVVSVRLAEQGAADVRFGQGSGSLSCSW